MIEKFLTTEQVASILQVHPFTILKFLKQGKLRGVKLGRVYRIKESDVQIFLEDRMTDPSQRRREHKELTEKKIEAEESSVKAYEIEKVEEKKDKNFYIIE